jgi:site-specific DNA-methyltransferase (adenine-specific)
MVELLHGDCLQVMRDLPNNSVDMILTDLPYGTTACKWDVVIPFEPLWEQWERICRIDGAIVLTAAQPFTSQLVMSNPRCFAYAWVWDKGVGASFVQAKRMPMRVHEDVLVFCPSGKTPEIFSSDGP